MIHVFALSHKLLPLVFIKVSLQKNSTLCLLEGQLVLLCC